MTAYNFFGEALFLILVASIVVLIVGLVTRRPRLWKIALWVLAAEVLVYVVSYFIFD